ncbi:hypothetical protein AgCh_011970 [Apium graveolens]
MEEQMANLRAGAGAKGIPLYKHIQEISGTKELVMPFPAFNVFNGGSHAGNNLAMHEFMILPTIYHVLKSEGHPQGFGQDACNVGDEGVSIEDPFDQDDWSSWSSLQSSVDIQIVGDDLLVTNPKKIAEDIQKEACNGLLLKVNQVGTVTKSIQDAFDSKLLLGGDGFIEDLSVGLASGHGLASGQIKTGAPCRSERLPKYNQVDPEKET